MVYSGNINGKYLLLALLVMASFVGYLAYSGNVGNFFSGRMFLGQVLTSTPLQQSDVDYISNLNGLAFLTGITTEEDLQQQFIETLLVHSQEFDKTSQLAAENYLKDYYDMTAPIPTKISEIVTTSAQKFLQGASVIPTQFNFTPFINQILSILANHQVATNNYQAVQRSQTTRSLLDALIKQF